MSFIGLVGFSSDWVGYYEQKIALLHAMITVAGKDNLRNKLIWTTERTEAFEKIKKEMQQAPALAFPDYDKPSLICDYKTRAGARHIYGSYFSSNTV